MILTKWGVAKSKVYTSKKPCEGYSPPTGYGARQTRRLVMRVIYVAATQAKQEDAERLVTNVGTRLVEIAKPYELNFVATETVITERDTIGRKAVLSAFLGALAMTMVLFFIKWSKNESWE